MDITDSKNASPPQIVRTDSHTHKPDYPPTSITTVPPPPSTPNITDVEQAAPAKSPQQVTGIRARIQAHPRPFAILAGLVVLLVVSLIGLVLYMVLVPNAFDGVMAIVNALFVLL